MAIRIPNVGTPINFGEVELKSEDWNDSFEYLVKQTANSYRQSILNLIRQLEDRAVTFNALGGEWAEVYVDSDGRLNSVDLGKVNATFDVNKYTTTDFNETMYVMIEANSISNVEDFDINDCAIFQISSGKWILYSQSGTNEEKRAKIYQTLFFGTTGDNARILSPYFIGVTSVQTTYINDVGKTAHFGRYRQSRNYNQNHPAAVRNYVGTFNNTIENDNCSLWFSLNKASSGSYSSTATVSFPGTTVIYSATSSVASFSTFGTDTTSFNVNNPTNVVFRKSVASQWGVSSTFNFLIVCKGSISWELDINSGFAFTFIERDYTEYNIPNFTDYVGSQIEGVQQVVITHNIPQGTYKPTISTCVGVPKVIDFEDGANIQYKLINATEDSGWLDSNKIESFTAFTSEPTQCIVRLIPKETDPTPGYPSISGFGVVSDTRYL